MTALPAARRVGITAAIVLALAAAALLAVVARHVSSRNAADAARHDAVSAAVRETRAAMSYSFKTLPHDVAVAEQGLTPAFRADYEKTIATSVRSLAEKYHATTAATVAAAGVTTASPNHARVLLFVDAVSNNSQLKAPRLDRYRINVAMEKQGGRWLINDLRPF
jgi:Mce-associated membrane protein